MSKKIICSRMEFIPRKFVELIDGEWFPFYGYSPITIHADQGIEYVYTQLETDAGTIAEETVKVITTDNRAVAALKSSLKYFLLKLYLSDGSFFYVGTSTYPCLRRLEEVKIGISVNFSAQKPVE